VTLDLVQRTGRSIANTVEAQLVFAVPGQEKPYIYAGTPPAA
jgi:hypothetical protein